MRGYIKHFFGCRECSVNFMKGAVHIEEVVHNPDDSILFLWQSHNKANFHLHGDITEDPEHLKVQYPPEELCPKCHKNSGNESSDAILWDKKEVLAFLKKIYSKDSMICDLSQNISVLEEEKRNDIPAVPGPDHVATKRAVALPARSQAMGTSPQLIDSIAKNVRDRAKVEGWKLRERDTRRLYGSNAGGMNSLDFGLCVLFYVTCIGLIFLLYFHLTVHKKIRLKSSCCCLEAFV